MNFSHLKTIAWLRWRLIANQFRKTGRVQRIFSVVILAGAMIGSIGLFFFSWLGSGALFEESPPSMVLLIWAGIVAAFLFAWSIGVLTDLQRSEPLSLNKFLHLPVSPRGAFLNNFLSSFISFSMILIFPIMLGLSLGMVHQFGFRMIPGVLLLLAFILLVTAITYQFRGWLAALMVNKRRRRTIITCLTFFVIIVAQLPNLMSMTTFKGRDKAEARAEIESTKTLAKLKTQLEADEITSEEFDASVADLRLEKKRSRQRKLDDFADYVRTGSIIVPVGWMPVGMESLARGDGFSSILVPLACLFGLIGLSVLSLQRSYRTTLRLYRGEIVETHVKVASSLDDSVKKQRSTWLNRLLEKQFPGLNDHQSAIAASTMVGVIRAPEAKMALLSPFLIMLLLGASFSFRDGDALPVSFRSFTGVGVASFAMLGIMQLVNNQFGFDRNGFRCMVLSPVKRVDILIGKNMGFAPFAIGIGAMGIIAMQIFIPMPVTHFLATFVQLGTVYLTTCMVSNLMSIRAPLAISSGTMKPVNMNVGIIVLQLLITILLPICLLPTMIPPGIELIVASFIDTGPVPVYLLLSFVLFGITLVVYRSVIRVQGRLLLEREKQILETVTQVGT